MGQPPGLVFPELTLVVDDIVLRPFGAGDVAATEVACNDEEIQRWLPLPFPYTRADARAWCLRISHSLRTTGDGLHTAVTTAAGDLIGTVGLKRTDWSARCTEIGYWTAPPHRGRGYQVRAARALARWALDGWMERVELRAATSNAASRRVADRAGFTFEGVLRNAGFTHHGRVDLALYSMTPADIAGPDPGDA
jgi:RimJ/RimL family protein N-acetyltransferase